MNIAIIGGGWVGCHLTYQLKKNHNVTLYEKNNFLFTETSYKNQNRLHLGFHYARNYNTRNMCQQTFNRFINDYEFATKKIKYNLYCIPYSESLIDFKTYLEIFRGYNFNVINTELNLVEGCINTEEKYIDFNKMYDFFNKNLSFTQKKITKKCLLQFSKKYDLVINATNNHILDENTDDSFYELTLSLIYEKIRDTKFDSLTFVDGNLFSIYPYLDNLYTVTDVEHTPIKKFKKLSSLNKFIKEFSPNELIVQKKKLIEDKIINYYPDFNKDFKYKTFFVSTKSKIKSQSDSRFPIITKNNNIVNCFTGKIQGIYLIEDYIKNLIKNIII